MEGLVVLFVFTFVIIPVYLCCSYFYGTDGVQSARNRFNGLRSAN